MNECDRIKRIMDRWELGEEITESDCTAASLHCRECKECSSQFASLVPFIERDAFGGPVGPRDEPSEQLVDSVMEEVGQAKPQRRIPVMYALAAAACLLLVAGVGAVAYRAGLIGRPTELVVHFELAAPEARNVALVGSFTQWESSRLEMTDPNGDGVWEISVRLKKGSIYTYNFLVDGSLWVVDPAAAAQIDDGFGGQNSVIRL
jgi:hypothetical protein